MKIKGILIRVICNLLVTVVVAGFVSPFTAVLDTLEGSTSELSYPYERVFTISAYYSPLPCQDRYATGNYYSDIRLNGNGTNGADGTPVYPGMVAAPKTYAFGTKMYIPGIGIVGVHDRGGAILASNGVEGVYDRLDIWMGYGDIGLKRALDWGKRTVAVTVYGVNSTMGENITLDGFSQAEAVPNECVLDETPQVTVETTYEEVEYYTEDEELSEEIESIIFSGTFSSGLSLGDQGDQVRALQEELNKLNYYKGEIHGIYDELTQHATFKFQQSQGLVGSASNAGAGIFGPKTMDRLNEIISARNYTKVLVAAATYEKEQAVIIAQAEAEAEADAVAVAVAEVETEAEPVVEVAMEEEVVTVEDKALLASELDFGIVSADVRKLQEFLRDQGYYNGVLITNYFGPITKDALIAFQLDNNLISDAEDIGAGRVGPGTMKIINNYL